MILTKKRSSNGGGKSHFRIAVSGHSGIGKKTAQIPCKSLYRSAHEVVIYGHHICNYFQYFIDFRGANKDYEHRACQIH